MENKEIAEKIKKVNHLIECAVITYDKCIAEKNDNNQMMLYKWYLNDKLAKEKYRPFEIISNKDWCPACGYWRAEFIELTKKNMYSLGEYVYYICPKCKGIIGTSNECLRRTFCSCAEIPHRFSCEMGRKLYFNAMDPCLAGNEKLEKFNY